MSSNLAPSPQTSGAGRRPIQATCRELLPSSSLWRINWAILRGTTKALKKSSKGNWGKL
ncbi:hypothetical protein D3C76_943030 [compost metagenome]